MPVRLLQESIMYIHDLCSTIQHESLKPFNFVLTINNLLASIFNGQTFFSQTLGKSKFAKLSRYKVKNTQSDRKLTFCCPL